MEHRTIAETVPAGRLGRIQDRVHFLDGHMSNEPRVSFLGWDDALPRTTNRRSLRSGQTLEGTPRDDFLKASQAEPGEAC